MKPIIKKAIEGGYVGMQVNNDTWHGVNVGGFQEKLYFLDPLFWKALGKECGWSNFE